MPQTIEQPVSSGATDRPLPSNTLASANNPPMPNGILGVHGNVPANAIQAPETTFIKRNGKMLPVEHPVGMTSDEIKKLARQKYPEFYADTKDKPPSSGNGGSSGVSGSWKPAGVMESFAQGINPFHSSDEESPFVKNLKSNGGA